MNCKAAIAAAALVAAAYLVPLGASWSETITIPSHVDGGKGSDVPATVNEAGFDRPATSDHPEGGGFAGPWRVLSFGSDGAEKRRRIGRQFSGRHRLRRRPRAVDIDQAAHRL